IFALLARGAKPELEIVGDGDQPLEQVAIGIFDGFVFLAGASLLVVLEIGLTAHGQIAEAIEISLQTGNFIFGFRFFGWRSNRRLVGNRSCRSSPLLLGLAQLGAF